MKITIITATRNSAARIAGCLASVNNQTYPNIEHIIIDGASTDNTLEIIQSTPNRVAKINSEPDHGIYDALNKGIRHATGDIIGFLHSDDTFSNTDTIKSIAQGFSPLSQGEMSEGQRGDSGNKGKVVHGIYGNLVFINDKNEIVRTWQSKPFNRKNICYGWMPPHPTLFLRREVYEKHGGFDISFRIAGDYDFMLRIMNEPEIQLHHLPEVITVMKMGGASTGSLQNILNKSGEDLRALRKNGFIFPPGVLAVKNLRKLPQLFRR